MNFKDLTIEELRNAKVYFEQIISVPIPFFLQSAWVGLEKQPEGEKRFLMNQSGHHEPYNEVAHDFEHNTSVDTIRMVQLSRMSWHTIGSLIDELNDEIECRKELDAEGDQAIDYEGSES